MGLLKMLIDELQIKVRKKYPVDEPIRLLNLNEPKLGKALAHSIIELIDLANQCNIQISKYISEQLPKEKDSDGFERT